MLGRAARGITPAPRLLVILIATAVAAWLLERWVQAAPPEVAIRPWLEIWFQLGVLVWVGALAALYLSPLPRPWKYDLAVALLALFMFGVVALSLKETPFAFGGLGGDALLHASVVAKTATLGGFPDMIYRDLPAFYPPLYHYLLGTAARMTGVEPWLLFKPGLLTTSLLLPFALYSLWRRVTSAAVAMGAAFALLVIHDWFKPYEWIVIMLFVPYWLHWALNVTHVRVEASRRYLLWLAAGSMVGALLFLTYYYFFFIGGLSLVVIWIGERVAARQNRTGAKAAGAARLIVINWPHVALLLAGVAALSAVYWLPYLWSMVSADSVQMLQNRAITEGKLPLPLEFVSSSLQGRALFASLIVLVVAADRRLVPRALLYLLSTLYVWIGIGYVAMLLDRPLLTWRSHPMVEVLLSFSLGAAIVYLSRIWRAPWQTARWARPGRAALATIALVLLGFFARETVYKFIDADEYTNALEQVAPTARLEAFDALVGDAPEAKVMLIDDGYARLLAYRPFFLFLPWNAYYSHPAGAFGQRVTLLERIASLHTPELARAALQDNTYDAVDFLLLQNQQGTWQVNYLDENFPNRASTRTIRFQPSLLTAPSFELRTSGDLAMHVPAAGGTIADLTPQSAQSLEARVQLYIWRQLFGAESADGPQADMQVLAASLQEEPLANLPRPLLLDLLHATDGPLRDAVREALRSSITHPADAVLVEAEQGPVLRLLGYDQSTDVESGRPRLDTYYEVLAPIAGVYDVWFHATPAAGGATEYLDHAFVVPTNEWLAQSVVIDTVLLPNDATAYDYGYGIWNSEDGARLTLDGGGDSMSLDLAAPTANE